MSLTARYLYPMNWDGDTEGMSLIRRWILNVTGEYESGQEDVLLVDISEMLTQQGEVPQRMIVDEISWMNVGCVSRLTWDRVPARDIMALDGTGFTCWADFGGLLDNSPAGEGTGDLLLTNISTADVSNFSFTITFRLKRDE
jgi:hypothetical protein